MSNLAYHNTSSPIHRGVFLIRHAFGRTLRPPDAAFTPINPDLHPDLTTRQRVELQTAETQLPSLSRKDQLTWIRPGELRRGRPISNQRADKPIDANGKVYTTRKRRIGDV